MRTTEEELQRAKKDAEEASKGKQARDSNLRIVMQHALRKATKEV